MSRRVAIYCRGKSVRANRAAEQALRRVASREGWTLAGTFVDESGPSKPQYDRVWRGITARDIDVVAVPSLAALAYEVSGVLAEILRLRDAGCDLYVLDPNLNTQSPVDRILFSIAEALKSVDDVSKRQRLSGCPLHD